MSKTLTPIQFLTHEERRAVAAFKRACIALPSSIRLYVIDGGSITICKYGVPSDDFVDTVDAEINAGAMLSDLHDDGEEKSDRRWR